jgi:hypothetical protein
MPVETLGQAFSYGWRVTARCAAGQQDGMSRHKECVYRADLDTETLVWTRGKGFPLSRLESRLRCPMCGSRDVVLMFVVPSERQSVSLADDRSESRRKWDKPSSNRVLPSVFWRNILTVAFAVEQDRLPRASTCHQRHYSIVRIVRTSS